MKKRIFSSKIIVGMVIILSVYLGIFSSNASVVFAADPSARNIKVENEYVIPDRIGWCTYYVIIATNETGKDISVSADFSAFDKSGKLLNTVNDCAEAVKKGQQFILYGQFVNSRNPGMASYKYDFEVKETENCTYTLVNLDTAKKGSCLEVSATNYSEKDIQGVGVRTVFLKKGKPVSFDMVNIADVGYTFHGGSTNSQVLGMTAGDYDDYIMTYTSAGDIEKSNY
jgi:hypothetical protein